jgi:hypothetical protein
VSPNGLPLEQEIRVISHLIYFFIQLGKRKMVEDEEDEVQAKKERLQLLQEGIFLLMLDFKE